MLFKSAPALVKDIDAAKGIVQMYWSAFGNEDSDGDIIERGSYAKSIQERGPAGSGRIKFLWQHDVWEPIGKPLSIVEDGHGLLAEVKVSQTTRGRDALVLYADGVITEHSVGIDVIRRSEEDKRRIQEIRLWEGSAVTWGANPLTPTVGMKAAGGEAYIKQITRQIESIRKAVKGPLSDDTCEQLEIALAHLESQFKAIGSAPANDPAPEDPPGGDGAPQEDVEMLLLAENLKMIHSRLQKK